MLKKTVSLLLSALLLCACLVFPVSAEDARPRFRDDGTFRILQLSDPQDDMVPSKDMLELFRLAVSTADPDLIVVTGDLVEDRRFGDRASDLLPGYDGVNAYTITGQLDHAKTLENVKTAVSHPLGVLESFGVPYVVALGDNDRKVGLSGEEWQEVLAAFPHCVFFDESPDDTDAVDYHVVIENRAGKPAFAVWLMDTELHGVTDAQLSWYKTEAEALKAANGGAPLPAFAFQHIPADDIGNLFVPCSPADEGAKKSANGYVRLDRTRASGYNFFGYEPCLPTAQFKAWKEAGDVVGAFFGHMHVEGFSGLVDGIELGFTYGAEFAKTGPWGFRVLTLREDDIRNYDNEVYTYTGSAVLGTARVQRESRHDYRESDGVFSGFLKLWRLLSSLVSAIVYLFR